MTSSTTPTNITYYVLEPVYTLFKVAILAHKLPNTKLCIGHGYIHLREPGYVQSLTRWSMGEHRYDVLSLQEPIVKAIRFLHDQNNKSLEIILNLVQIGLMSFSKCYDSDNNINLHILRIIRIVQDKIQNIHAKNFTLSHSIFITKHAEIYPTFINNDFISQIWSDNEIIFLTSQFKMIHQAKRCLEKETLATVIAKHVEIIDKVLDNKSKEFMRLMNNIQT